MTTAPPTPRIHPLRAVAALLLVVPLALALAACGAPDSAPLASDITAPDPASANLADHAAADHASLALAAFSDRALPHLRGPRLAAVGGERALRLKRAFVDELGMTHTRFSQHLDGVPVWGAEAIVHLRADGSLDGITDDLVRGLRIPSTTPRLDRAEAVRRAVAEYGCEPCLTAPPAADLLVIRRGGGDHLAWRVRLERDDGTPAAAMPIYFIDAHDGRAVFTYDNLQTGSGTSLYSGTVTVDTYLKSKTWYLEDIARKIGTFDMRSGTGSYYRFTDADNVWSSATQKAAVDVHYGMTKAFDYFKNVHGRNGFDGAGGPGYYLSIDGRTRLVSSRVHYGSSYANASFSGSYFSFGDGDGVDYGPLVSLDIVGHEATHAVIDAMGGLTYYGESGALNEGIADIFGALIERYARGESADTWKQGEQVYTPANGNADAIRFMENPHAADDKGYTADDDPDHYSERYTGGGDNGGVHINSGIVNKAFHLLARGGSHHKGGSMTGIGPDAAAAIWFKALSAYMTPNITLLGARRATISAAEALYGAGSAQAVAVDDSWRLVGVAPPPPDGEKLVNGGFEGFVDPWGLEGHAWYSNAAYPHAGTGYVYMGYNDNAVGSLYGDLTIQSTWTSANLTFWLNVTTNETDPGDYDRLKLEVRDAGGYVLQTLGTWSNRHAAAAGTYTQMGPFDLLPYKGQLVRIQLTATNDYAAPTTFRIDDVSLR